jgi:two-component system C4-dicarboxylate transport response regulator DctD
LAELVGHVREAFPETPKRAGGAVHAARGGTLIMRDVDRAAPTVEAALRGMVETRRATPVGSDHPRDVDVRLILTAAPESTASDEAGSGWRKTMVRVELPPLRARPDDIVGLSRSHVDAAGQRGRAVGGVRAGGAGVGPAGDRAR